MPVGACLDELHEPARRVDWTQQLLEGLEQEVTTVCIGPKRDRVIKLLDQHATDPSFIRFLHLEGFMESWSIICRDGAMFIVVPDGFGANWLLQPNIIYFRPAYCDEGSRHFTKMQQLTAMMNAWPVPVIGRPRQLCPNNSKLYQLTNIVLPAIKESEAAVDIPASYVVKGTMQHQRINDKEVVVKALSNIRTDVLSYCQFQNQQFSKNMDHMPVLCQQIEYGKDIRVHTIKYWFYGMRIETSAKRNNYRYHTRHDRIEPYELTSSLKAFLSRVLHYEARWLLGVDFIERTDGSLICLEINPSPGWSAFHEQETVEDGQFVARLMDELGAV
jgi:hypothetical protein